MAWLCPFADILCGCKMDKFFANLMHKVFSGLLCLGVFFLFGFTANGTSLAYHPSEPAVEAQAGTFYVSISGSDFNPGTQSWPWRTIQKAANTMTPGSTCIVLPGNYGERVHITTSGALGAPISFEAAGPVSLRGFTIVANYINIQGFDITDTDYDSWIEGWGIYLKGSNCLIEDNYIYYCTHGGITLTHNLGQPTQSSNCVVRNNRFYRNGQLGVEVNGRNHLIEGNEVWRTIQHHPDWPNPPSWVDADGMRFFGSGHVFRMNYIHDITYNDPENVNPHIDCFQSWGSDTYEAAQNVTFERNRCQILEPPLSSTSATQGWMVHDGANLILRNNIVQAYNMVNLINSSGFKIANNTFVGQVLFPGGTGSNGILLYNSPYMTVKNNIFVDLDNLPIRWFDDQSRVGLDTDFNDVFRSDGPMPTGTPSPNDLWDVDPLLEYAGSGDFHLSPASPCINRGTNLISLVPDDYEGNVRPNGSTYDIGAYEYVGIVSRPGLLILDDVYSGFSTTFVQDQWREGLDLPEQRWGYSFRYNRQIGSGDDFATWAFNVSKAGQYDVYARWVEGSEKPSDVPYTVNYDGGSTTIRVDQRVNGGHWNRLGTFAFRDQGSVVVSDDASSGQDVVADAIKLVYQWPYSAYLPFTKR